MGQLTALEEWDIYANPLTFPPAEILQMGMNPTLSYLRDYEAMLLMQILLGIAVVGGGIIILVLVRLKLLQRRRVGKKKR